MKQAFRSVNFRADSLAMIDLCNRIVEGYQAQGYRLSLRQLYYQLVTRNAIPNQERAYKNLGRLLSEGRLAGLIDWDAIEDRVRIPQRPNEFKDLHDLVEVALRSYRLPRWEGQDNYVELWVEKDALSGVLAPLAREYHITLMINRGYSSQSAMYEAAQRFWEAQAEGRACHLIYLGDMDPSGEDMVRDVRDRLDTFGCSVIVDKVAITTPQVRRYNPPPNPAKMSDSRARGYVAEHGLSAWEVDALPPDVLQTVIRRAVEDRVSLAKMNAVKNKEEQDKRALNKAMANLQKEGGRRP